MKQSIHYRVIINCVVGPSVYPVTKDIAHCACKVALDNLDASFPTVLATNDPKDRGGDRCDVAILLDAPMMLNYWGKRRFPR